jgi:hypothetical protein
VSVLAAFIAVVDDGGGGDVVDIADVHVYVRRVS